MIKGIIHSFSFKEGKGIPLGNLTSQLFSNVYLDCLDQFIKRKLQVKHYIRYADDFVFLSPDKEYLTNLIPIISKFLEENLRLSLHPNKIILRKWHQGVDFLGFIHFPYHSILRTKTKNRILRRVKASRRKLNEKEISEFQFQQILQSYLGRLKHCRSRKIVHKLF